MPADNDMIPLLYELNRKLRSAESSDELLGHLAKALGNSFGCDTTSIWLLNRPQEIVTCVSATGPGKEKLQEMVVRLGEGVIGGLVQNQRELWLSSDDDPEGLIPKFGREFGQKINFLAFVPLRGREELFGAILLSHRTRFRDDQRTRNMNFLKRLAVDSALAAEDIYNRETLAKRTRDLRTLSEVGTELNASLDLDRVLTSVVLNIMGHFIVEQVAILLLDDKQERLVVVESRGLPEEISSLDFSCEGELAQVLMGTQQPIFCQELEEDVVSLEERERLEELGAFVLLPVLHQDEFVGFITVGHKATGEAYDESEVEFLSTIAKQAGIALKNAMLFEAERKANELSLLLEISKEITSTLDIDRVMHAFVNLSSQIIDYDRASVALLRGEDLVLSAVSGQEKVDRKATDMVALEGLLSWVTGGNRSIYVTSLEGQIQAENEETKDRLKEYFKTSQMKSFLAVPLVDEEGALGALSMESQSPSFLTESSLEVIEILSSQLTVAIRNAELYQKIPLAKVIRPIVAKKRAFFKIPRRKMGAVITGAVIIIAFLLLWRSELKVTCPMEIWPQRTYTVGAEVDGIVREILVREGDQVRAGQPLARLHNDHITARLNQVKVWLTTSRGNARNLFAANRIDQYQMEQNEIRKLQAELEMLETQQDKTEMVSPISGTVLTPLLEERVGEYLEKGDFFCEVAGLDSMRAEINFPAADIHLAGENQRIKLLISAFPEKTFWGTVERVSSRGNSGQENNAFLIRGSIENTERLLKPGMTGHARIYCGKRSLAYVVFRKPGRFLRQLAWRLFGL